MAKTKVEATKASRTRASKIGERTQAIEEKKKAVLDADFDSLFTPSKPPPAKKRVTKQVVNPLFESMLPWVEDPFWAEKIKNACYGKFPRGFSFYNGCLNHKKGAKTHSTLLPTNPEEALKETIAFFQNWGSIYSTTENSKNEYYPPAAMIENYEPITWATTSVATRESLLFKYIGEQKRIRNLNAAEVSSLRSAVMTGVNNKLFTEKDIDVQDNRITRIDGLEWDPHYGRFYLANEQLPEIKKSGKTRPTNEMGIIYKEWERFNKRKKERDEDDSSESMETE